MKQYITTETRIYCDWYVKLCLYFVFLYLYRIEQENKDIFKSNTVKFEPSWLDFQQQWVWFISLHIYIFRHTLCCVPIFIILLGWLFFLFVSLIFSSVKIGIPRNLAQLLFNPHVHQEGANCLEFFFLSQLQLL